MINKILSDTSKLFSKERINSPRPNRIKNKLFTFSQYKEIILCLNIETLFDLRDNFKTFTHRKNSSQIYNM